VRIRLLGSGTPTPSLRRMCSGYVVEIGNDVIVFDHGFGAHHRLLGLGIHASRVSHLFFTHLHYAIAATMRASS
jgi:ribonuclease Z